MVVLLHDERMLVVQPGEQRLDLVLVASEDLSDSVLVLRGFPPSELPREE